MGNWHAAKRLAYLEYWILRVVVEYYVVGKNFIISDMIIIGVVGPCGAQAIP
jgi:hypothetical protein